MCYKWPRPASTAARPRRHPAGSTTTISAPIRPTDPNQRGTERACGLVLVPDMCPSRGTMTAYKHGITNKDGTAVSEHHNHQREAATHERSSADDLGEEQPISAPASAAALSRESLSNLDVRVLTYTRLLARQRFPSLSSCLCNCSADRIARRLREGHGGAALWTRRKFANGNSETVRFETSRQGMA
jgi:hypothetical protein